MRLLFAALFSFVMTGVFAQDLRSGGVLKPEQANMDIRHYTIVLDVDPVKRSIDGHTVIDLVLQKDANDLLFDLVNLLTVKKIEVNDKPYSFSHANDLIRITSASAFRAGKTRVKIIYGGVPGVSPRAPWTGGFQWEKDSLGNPWIAITCQGEGAKIYFPCKDHPSDEPNEGADMMITVPKGLVVAGPGLLQKVTTKKNKSTYHWKTNYTISNYCILFNVGKYKVVSREYTTVNGNKVPMQFYVLEQHADKAPHHLEMLERSARILEKYFGEYPWVKEKIAIAETPHLGMEHQTMNAYGNRFQYTKVGGEDFDWLLHHEFGHEWWANKVTNRDWAHMWIQEGICSFGDALYYREMEGEESYLRRMKQTSYTLHGRIPVVRGEQVDTDSAYAGPIYGKGAFFMHTLRFVMGDEVFFPTLKKLATDPRYTYDNTVVTADVEQLFSGAHGRSLKPLFDLYLYTPDRLDVRVQQVGAERYNVSLMNFEMPLPFEIQTDSGIQKVTLQKSNLLVQSKTIPIVDPRVYYLKRVIIE